MSKRSLALAFAFLACLQAVPAADLFTRVRKLQEIKTEHFSFIFPGESRGAAEHLARNAERIYGEVARDLGAKTDLNIPVVLTPDAEGPNGYCTVYPSTRIALYLAAISPNDGFALLDDDLLKIFRHELTHAVTFNIRSPFWAFLAALFTDAISPAYVTAPENFVEGATVSLESLDGFGRAAETDYVGIIQQDIIEGRFKSFAESAGFWQDYPFGIYYIYGGAFSRYLQEAYGMEAYAALWKSLGGGDVIAGMEGWLGLKGAFKLTYGLRLDAAWENFRQWASLKRPVVTAVKPISRDFERFGATCSDGKRLYWAESTAVKAYDPETGEIGKLFDSDTAPNRLSVSPDGKRLLVSTARLIDGLAKLKPRVWNLEKGKWESAAFPTRLREAAWLPDGSGIVACRMNGSTMDLVLVRNGTMDILFKGGESVVPACPCPFGAGEIAFLLKAGGTVRLARMDLESKTVRILDSSGRIKNASHLSSDGTTLSFSWDSDLSLYKLGRYGEGGLTLQNLPISGGVRYPVSLGGETYYVGAFSRGQKAMVFPKDNPELAMEAVESEWIALPEEIASAPSAFNAPPSMEAKPYDPLPWLLLPQLRYPYPTFKEAALTPDNAAALLPSYLNGSGISCYGEDPTAAQSLAWSLAYRWYDRFAPARITYANQAFPTAFAVSAYDELGAPYQSGDPAEWRMARRLGLSVSASQPFVLSPSSRVFSWQASGSWTFVSEGESVNGEASSSPYLWPFSGSILPFSASASYRDLLSPAIDENAARGFTLNGRYQGYLEPSAWDLPKGFLSAEAVAYLPYLNFRLRAAGALSAYPGLTVGTGGPRLAEGAPYLAGYEYPFYGDYSGAESQGPYYLYGDGGIGYSFRTDAKAKGTDLYARSFNFRLGYRASFSGGTFLNSLYGQATAQGGWARGLGLKAGLLQAGLELDWLLSRTLDSGAHPIQLRPILAINF